MTVVPAHLPPYRAHAGCVRPSFVGPCAHCLRSDALARDAEGVAFCRRCQPWQGDLTRVEIVGRAGRLYVGTELGSVQLSVQDRGRTLKVFVDRP